MFEQSYINMVSRMLGIGHQSVAQTIILMNEGASIPFISRYRKEATGNLDEVQIASIFKQYKKLEETDLRKRVVLEAIEEQGKLTEELKRKIEKSYDINEIEDLYLPFKKKRKTKADLAREKGLEPFAKLIFSQEGVDILAMASQYINEVVLNQNEAIDGSRDIIAEWVSEMQDFRTHFRLIFRKHGILTAKVVKTKIQDAQHYKDYFAYTEAINRCPSHRFLAIMRGEQEGLLRVAVEIDEQQAILYMKNQLIFTKGESASIIAEAIEDSYQRLILPSVENQIRTEFKAKADVDAIQVFTENLRQLLLAAPLGQKAIMAIDPGFRTGCKLVCLDDKGDLIHNTNIYPHEPQNQVNEAVEIIKGLVYKHDVKAIAIGNGTASRETKDLIDKIEFSRKVEVFIVSENGASIYSASDVAREEFPDKDVTVRGAVSIGRRLMDPLAELVKIEAKSIGVGQYQHDVDQALLKESLDQTVISCVNKVGINLNTASKHLLTYVSGLGATMSQNITKFRSERGSFTSRSQLLEVPRLGPKAFEQCAGFLRIREADNPLDNTGVHPESYGIVNQMASDLGVSIQVLIENSELRKKINLQKYVNENVGILTLNDIMKELDKPGLDPRGEARAFSFDEKIKTFEDITEGIILAGIVTNLTNFGAFIDIGIKGDAMLHISQITRKFIKSPGEILKLHQQVMVKVLNKDLERKRVNLTMLF